MRTKRAVVAVIVMLFAASVGPVTSASAETSEPWGATGQAVDVSQPEADLSEEVIEAIERDVGIPAGQVETRLANENSAAETAEAVDAQAGEAFAGAWFADGAADLTVAVTDRSAVAEVESTDVQVEVVDHSVDELEAMASDLDASEQRAPAGVVGWFVDVTTNSVAVEAVAGSRAEARDFAADVLGEDVAADAVRVEVAEAAPEPFYDVRGGDAYYTGQYRCSIGFSVVGGYTTAGHCGDVGATTRGHNQVDQGVFRGSQFPGSDHAWVEVNQNWTPRPVVNDHGGGTVEVHGSQEAAVGAVVCRSGSTTGWRCGTIQAKNQTVRYAEGTVYGLTQTSACAEGGDSGGSFISGNQAQGMTSGGSGNCSFGGTTFFQPLNPALQDYGLTLVTTDGDTPPPTPGNCEDLDQVRSGTLSEGAYGIEPDGSYYYASTSGVHRGCLEGPAAADYRLYLQRWAGWTWTTVASDTGPGASKELTHNGTAGYYRWIVWAYNGSGAYTFGFQVD